MKHLACLLVLAAAAFAAPAAAAGMAGLTADLVVGAAQLGVAAAPDAAYLCNYVAAAGAAGVKLLAFPEDALDAGVAGGVAACAGAAGVNVVLPVFSQGAGKKKAEGGQATLIIDAKGTQVASRKSVLGKKGGTGKDLLTVELEGAGKVCTLLGNENYNLLARYALYTQGCEYLVSPTALTSRVWVNHAKSVSREGRMFVISVGQVDPAAALVNGEAKDGGAIIVGPDGLNYAGPVYTKGLLAEANLCSPKPSMFTVDWAKAGCEQMDAGWGGNPTCVLTPVGADGGFVLSGKTTRYTVLAKKTYQDNVGNYHAKWAWQVEMSTN